jgi:hypothetical protein
MDIRCPASTLGTFSQCFTSEKMPCNMSRAVHK